MHKINSNIINNPSIYVTKVQFIYSIPCAIDHRELWDLQERKTWKNETG